MSKKTKNPKLSHRVLWQYLLTLAISVAVLAAGIIVCRWVCEQKIWYWDDPLYQFLNLIKKNILAIGFVLISAAWTIITAIYLRRLIRYIDSIVDAAKQLTHPEECKIELPAALYGIERDLNSARETALRNSELAREAEKRKNDLIVYLAHDLKTPLTSVIGYLTLLRDEPQISAETRAHYTGIALDKAERLEMLINEFFDITRFNLTTLTLERERINLTFMLNQTISEFLPMFDEKGLTVKSEIQPGVELVCDPDKLERVFDNLLRNAVIYSYPESEIYLGMTADESRVTVVCRNRGKTIPKEKLDRIFEQFFRLDSARQSNYDAFGYYPGSGRKQDVCAVAPEAAQGSAATEGNRHHPGSGLGLAIAKEIVTLHGGEISAKSENESVEFTVILPRGG